MKSNADRVYHAKIEHRDLGSHHYAGLVVTLPGRSERLWFCGMDRDSAQTAAKKAFGEYLEARALWDIGATEETSRSG
jgi:hypothetical protein